MSKESETINHKTIWMLVLVFFVVLLPAHASAQETPWQEHMAAGGKAMQEGRYADAEKSYLVALKEAEGFGPQDLRLATSLDSLAKVYMVQGRYAEGEPLLRRALGILEKAVGLEHPDVARSLVSLGWLYGTQGKISQVEPLFKRALAIDEKSFGPDDPSR